MHDGRDDNEPMNAIQLPEPTSWGGALLVSDLGVIAAQGPDAAAFLHGQLSQDVNGQTAAEARLAAYCTAKGRMLASTINLRPESEQVLMLTDRQVLPGVLKRLGMFVLRSKVKLTDATESMAVVGLLGQAGAAALGAGAPLAAWQVVPHNDGQLLRLPDVQGTTRWLWVGPAASAATLVASLPALPIEQWRWLDVISGVPRIESTTVDQFVPQMVNFELIGGVNFKKGCYPGQEVVARSQYRGTTKRRAFVLHADRLVSPGQEVFSEADPGQPAGLIINATPIPGSDVAFSALVELKLTAVDSGLYAGAVGGPRLTLGSLPYELPKVEAEA
jgi:folate-binding protein YgfZ